MSTLFYLSIFLVCVSNGVKTDPRGHLQPFGEHTVPHDIETVTEFPTPQEFFEKYLSPGRPVVFKSILKRVNFPPFRLWTDDYIKTNYGDIKVEIEEGKKETRNAEMKMETLKEFLEKYKKEDIYLVQDLKRSMFKDMFIPRSLQCGGFQDFLQTVVIWFSSGGTKSVVHNDAQENFNCLLDGTKDIVAFDKKYKDLIMADGFRVDGSYSELDVDSVDMNKYPKVKEIPTFKVTLEAGDCLYIPFKWYHQVNSFGSRNIAMNVWFTHVPWFNYTDCENVSTTEQTVPFEDYGFITSANTEKIALLDDLFDIENVTKEIFTEIFIKPEADDKAAILNYIDKNGDSAITWDDVLLIDPRDFIPRFKDSLKVSPTFFGDAKELAFSHEDDDVRFPEHSKPHDEF